MMFLKALIVFTRLQAMWLFATGCRQLMLNNNSIAVFDFIMAGVIVYLEADWLVKRIEADPSKKE